MKPTPTQRAWAHFQAHPDSLLMIQTPLPHFLHTLPILITIEGQGSGRQGPPPLAPPEKPATHNYHHPTTTKP